MAQQHQNVSSLCAKLKESDTNQRLRIQNLSHLDPSEKVSSLHWMNLLRKFTEIKEMLEIKVKLL